MSEKVIKAIMAALRQGAKVELTMLPDGTVKCRTVTRKELKI